MSIKSQKFALLCALLTTMVLVFSVTAGAQERPYEGVSLNIALPAGYTESPPILDALNAAAEELGTIINVSWYSVDELRDKLLVDFIGGTPAWDIVFVHSPSRGQWVEMGLITPIGQWIEENPELVDENLLDFEDYYDISIQNYTYNDVWIGPPLFVTGVAMFYRTDLFEHPEEQENFLAEYGYELVAPETYEQFRDVSEFFTRRAGEQLVGETLTADFYGTTQSNRPTAFLWHEFVNYLMAFGADNIYDPETMMPTFNSPEAIEAGEYYVSLAPFNPPGHMTMVSGEATSMFADGSVAVNIEYFLRAIDMCFDPEKSNIHDRIDFTLLPSVEGVEGREHAAHFGGNCISLFGLSNNKEAAYKTIELAFSAQVMKELFLEKYAPYGWIPPRPSILEDPEVIDAVPFMEETVERILDPDYVYYFELPALPEYFAAIDICGAALSSALAGEVDVETAFNQAQVELEDLFYQAGYIQ